MIPLLIGALALLGGTIALAYWDDIVDWLNDFLPKVKEAWNNLKSSVAHAAMMAAEKVKQVVNGIKKFIVKIMHKMYYKNEKQQWVEETTTRTIPENEVPPFIRAKIQQEEQEADITDDMRNELKLEI